MSTEPLIPRSSPHQSLNLLRDFSSRLPLRPTPTPTPTPPSSCVVFAPAPEAKFATVDIDRALDKAFQGFLRVNTAPTFTTRNDNLYIITTQIEELHGRRMTHAERCRLSGVEPRSISSSHGKKTVIKALGNMMPVDVIGRVLNQILLVIRWGVLQIWDFPPSLGLLGTL
eukprot:9493768-Pyramimonas_sp.AAC.2